MFSISSISFLYILQNKFIAYIQIRYCYSCEKSINYILGDSKFNKIAVRLYMLYFLVPIIFFSNLEADLLWAITDLISGMYVIVTLILIFANLKEIKRLFNDFWYRFLPEKEKGENPPVVSYGEVKNK